jgi:hypothetical protein
VVDPLVIVLDPLLVVALEVFGDKVVLESVGVLEVLDPPKLDVLETLKSNVLDAPKLDEDSIEVVLHGFVLLELLSMKLALVDKVLIVALLDELFVVVLDFLHEGCDSCGEDVLVLTVASGASKLTV